ncbi:MAG TPA: potassium channel family protein [Planctomycetota bacterium]|nr:potassium channel family protein [Planctomycetota bacterium]
MANTLTEAQANVLGEAVAQAAAKQLDDHLDLDQWAQETFNDEPFTKLVALVGLGAALFYKAEVGKNPKVNSYWDALVYVSTCASVGYGDIFAHTPVGKAIGSIVMTIGPAMANAAFDGSAKERAREAEEQKKIQLELLATMKEILAELRASKK